MTEMESDWFFGKFGFVLRDAFPVELIPCRGQLGFFMPPQDALDALAVRLLAPFGETAQAQRMRQVIAKARGE